VRYQYFFLERLLLFLYSSRSFSWQGWCDKVNQQNYWTNHQKIELETCQTPCSPCGTSVEDRKWHFNLPCYLMQKYIIHDEL